MHTPNLSHQLSPEIQHVTPSLPFQEQPSSPAPRSSRTGHPPQLPPGSKPENSGNPGLSCRGRPARPEPARMPSPRRCRDRRGYMEPQQATVVLTIARGLRAAGLWMQLWLRLGLRLRLRCAVLYARTSRLAAPAARAAGAPRPEGGARRKPMLKRGGCGPQRNSQSGA